MTTLESHYEIQFSTINEPNYWRSIGDANKSFVETSQKVREYMNKELLNQDKLIHSFRIVEKRFHITTEEIKTFKV